MVPVGEEGSWRQKAELIDDRKYSVPYVRVVEACYVSGRHGPTNNASTLGLGWSYNERSARWAGQGRATTRARTRVISSSIAREASAERCPCRCLDRPRQESELAVYAKHSIAIST